MNRKNKKIVFANDDKVKALQPYVNRILQALGHEEAFISNESKISDFIEVTATVGEALEFSEDLAGKLGLETIDSRDYIIDVAHKLKGGAT